jgi:hypothetical protein
VAGGIVMKNMTMNACPKCGMTPDPDRQLHAAEFFLARRAGWNEKRDDSLSVTIGGQTMSIEDQVKRQEDRLEIYRWMTTAERHAVLDIMERAQRRMRGEEEVVQLDVLPPLEGEIKVDGPPTWLDEPGDDGDDSEGE